MSWPAPRRDDRPIRSWEDADSQLQEARAEIARLRLTDAERTAIQRLIEDYAADGEPASEGVVATLRGLLERMGQYA